MTAATLHDIAFNTILCLFALVQALCYFVCALMLMPTTLQVPSIMSFWGPTYITLIIGGWRRSRILIVCLQINSITDRHLLWIRFLLRNLGPLLFPSHCTHTHAIAIIMNASIHVNPSPLLSRLFLSISPANSIIITIISHHHACIICLL